MRAVWRRRGWRLLALMLVCTLPALFAWRVWPRERLLLQRAVRVADADDFDNWASDHEYLSVDLSDYIDAAHSPVITRWDLITGSTRSFIVKQCPHGTHTTILSSPDGRWALYWGLEGDIMAVNLQTGRRLSWPSPGDTYHFSNCWLADSRRWLQATTLPDYVTIYNLDMPTRSQRLSFPHAKTARWQEFMLDYSLTTRDHLLAVERKWAESYSDRLLIKGLTIREYRLLPQPAYCTSRRAEKPGYGHLSSR